MNDMLDGIAEELPQDFYIGLNGGIVLLPDTKYHPKAKNSDLYILGEYVRDRGLGRYIAIYYGSVCAVYGSLPKDKLWERLQELLVHEFTHHIESLSGERGLEVKDEVQLGEYEARAYRKEHK